MKYYRVKQGYDNWRLYTRKGNHFEYLGILIGNELLTEKEHEKYLKVVHNIDLSKVFEEVEIPKSKIYWCFGARFA